MDPVTAFANLITSLTQLVTAMVEGQTPEQKAKLWDWYIADVAFWRRVLKIDKDGQP